MSDFLFGTSCFMRGVVAVVFRPRLWPYAIPPLLMTVVVSAYAVKSSRTLLADDAAAADRSVTESLVWLTDHWKVTWFVPFVGVSLLITCIVQSVAAVALDTIGRAEHGRDDRLHFESAAESLFRTTSTTFVAFFVVLVPITALALVTLVLPRVWPVTAALALLLASLMLVWNFIDYMMWFREVGSRARIEWLYTNVSLVLGFGLPCAFILLIPGAAFLLLLIGVAGATHLVVGADKRCTKM